MVGLLHDTTIEAPIVGRGTQNKERVVRDLSPPCILLGPHLPHWAQQALALRKEAPHF